MSFWRHYNCEWVRKYVPDVDERGTSSLWSARIAKGYGSLKYTSDYFNKDVVSTEDIINARKTRPIFYEQLLSPHEIKNALKYGPVVLDVDIYESIFSDIDGIVTLPDEGESKLDVGHCFLVFGHTPEGLEVNAGNWKDWGIDRNGLIPYTYLKNNFVAAFTTRPFKFYGQQTFNGYRRIFRKKIKIRNRKWSISTYQINSIREIKSTLFNVEIMDEGGTLSAWIHLSIDSNRNVEILDLFVLEEYRRLGLGSYLFNQVAQVGAKAKSLQCYISAHDLMGDNEDHLISFLLKNNYTVVPDKTRFRDARFRIQTLESIS